MLVQVLQAVSHLQQHLLLQHGTCSGKHVSTLSFHTNSRMVQLIANAKQELQPLAWCHDSGWTVSWVVYHEWLPVHRTLEAIAFTDAQQ